MIGLRISIAFLAPYAVFFALEPLLYRGRRTAIAALCIIWALVLPLPLLVPSEYIFTRFLVGLYSVMLGGKAHDLRLGRTRPATLGARLQFALTPLVMVQRRDHLERSRGRADDLAILKRGLLWAVPGSALVMLVFHEEKVLRAYGFVVEHFLKLVAFYVMLHGVLYMVTAVARMLGQPAREVFDNVFAARTPADFWRRYNRSVGQFLYEDVFKPSGGRRNPIWGTLVTFVFSALGHEYLFSISIGRVEGYQTAFFLIQGLAVALTLRVRPKGWKVPVAIALTLAFNLATSFLFFASLQHYYPFWSDPPG